MSFSKSNLFTLASIFRPGSQSVVRNQFILAPAPASGWMDGATALQRHSHGDKGGGRPFPMMMKLLFDKR